MKHNFYQILLFYICLILFFLIFGTLILSYSLGYRYDFNKHQIIKTGIIRLNPIEKNCSIYLDGNLINQKKNQKTIEIPNLIPNKYYIEIKCANYQSWNKQIDIQAGKIHNENNILFIPINPSIQEIAYINQATIHQSNIAYVNAEKLYIITKDSDQVQFFPQVQINPNIQIKWLNKNIIAIINPLENKTNIQILNIYNGNLANINLDVNLKPNQLIGIDNITNENIYFLLQNNLFKTNINSNSNITPTLFLENIFNPIILNNHIYYQENNNSDTIIAYNLLFKNKTNIKLDQNITSFFLIPEKNWLLLNSNNISYIYEIYSSHLNSLNTNVFNYEISPDQQNTLFLNDNEIVIVDNNMNTNTLLRLSSKINGAIWKNNGNIIYATDNTIQSIDLNGENNKIIIKNEKLYNYIVINKYQEKILTIEKQTDQDLLTKINLKNSN